MVPDRKRLREDPPSILVTNTTMLEYMLMRAQDGPILERSQGTLRWIVLDEAHSYVGAQAAEMALLLRRVREAFGVAPEDVYVSLRPPPPSAKDRKRRRRCAASWRTWAACRRIALRSSPVRSGIPICRTKAPKRRSTERRWRSQTRASGRCSRPIRGSVPPAPGCATGA